MTDTDKLNNLRHSLAHLLAAAVMELYPDTKRTIGPSIDNGFYFDFEFSKPISDEDLPKIEKVMRKILPTWKKFEKHELTADEAKKEYPGNPYKRELIDEFTKDGQKVTFYKSGDYWDLCKGRHVENLKEISSDAFKLDRIAGAYWRGDEKNKMLTRIYGLAFETKKDLDAYIAQREEAKKRDHRKLGRELDLFVFSELVGVGMPLFTPKGNIIREQIIGFSRELNNELGFGEVHTPNINKAELFKISGHYDKYKEDMRSFSQDDGHIFCREDQVKDEISNVLSAIEKALKAYKIEYWMRLSLRDPNKKEKNIKNKEVEGEAAFYGPKIDIMAVDAIGREWQISTIQLDFNQPKRFELEYTDKDGGKKIPVMIHRALIGSPDRFLGILIEHYAGAFPLWLAPVQVKVIPVRTQHN